MIINYQQLYKSNENFYLIQIKYYECTIKLINVLWKLTTFSGMLNSDVLLAPAGVHPEGAEVVVGLAVRTADWWVEGGTLCRTATCRSAIWTGHTAGSVRARRLVTQFCNTRVLLLKQHNVLTNFMSYSIS